jgi:hypothetical protein
MSRRGLCGVATTLLVAAAACTGPAPRGEGVGELRVCAEQSFDSEAAECNSDERAKALASPTVYCSIEFVDRNDERFEVEMKFEGERVSSAQGAIDRDSGSLWVRARTSNDSPLPAGRWDCRLVVADESLAASFRTGGEVRAAPVTQVACLTSNADGNECPAEVQADLFEHPPSVTCNSLIVGAAGERVRIGVFRDAAEVASYTTPVAEKNVQLAYGTVDPDVLEIEATALPSGSYDCRFAVGDTQSWDVSFTVID